MKNLLYKYLTLLAVFINVFACQDLKTDTENQNAQRGATQQELPESNYVITLPDNYKVLSHYGVDYENYRFVPIDTTNHLAPTAGIIFGDNVACQGSFLEKYIQKDTLSSMLLDSQVNWIRYKLDSVYFAEAFLDGKFCAEIIALQKNEVDSFISIFKSLKPK